MKKILIELDAKSARDLERVAPTGKRMRAEFIRRAIRTAIDIALDRSTEAAYRRMPLDDSLNEADLQGWDERNGLAHPPPKRSRSRRAA